MKDYIPHKYMHHYESVEYYIHTIIGFIKQIPREYRKLCPPK